jgi:predicted AlkP superfamily pyrophosphatase or phosphodiesterase
VKKIFILSVVFALSLLICADAAAQTKRQPAQSKAVKGIQGVKHVILIGLDGWGAYSLEKAEMPNAKRLMETGSHTLESRSVLPSSSACNWASMFMGAGPELHGYTMSMSKTPEVASRVTDEYGFFPSIFSILHTQRPDSKIAMLYEWDGIGYLAPKEALDIDMHVPPVNRRSVPLADAAVNCILTEKPTLMLVSFDDPDATGHKSGHDTPEYYLKLHELDGYIGMIEQAVAEAGIQDETIIILTADHGGMNKTHGGATLAEMQIPFIINGRGVKNGFEITDSVMQYDTAATIAYIFGLDQPQAWIGRAVRSAFK